MPIDPYRLGQLKRIIDYWIGEYDPPPDLVIEDWRLSSGIGIDTYVLLVTVRPSVDTSDAAWIQSAARSIKTDLNDMAFDLYLHKDVVIQPKLEIAEGGST